MKKQILLVFASYVLGLFVTAVPAFASTNDIEDVIVTDFFRHPKSTFDISAKPFWREVPFLHIFFKEADLNAVVNEIWTSPTGDVYSFQIKNNSFPLPFDLSKPYDFDFNHKRILNTLPDWFSRKEKGLWTWSAQLEGGSNMFNGNFMITPEPISSALFLLGSGALAMRIYRKRKQKA